METRKLLIHLMCQRCKGVWRGKEIIEAWKWCRGKAITRAVIEERKCHWDLDWDQVVMRVLFMPGLMQKCCWSRTQAAASHLGSRSIADQSFIRRVSKAWMQGQGGQGVGKGWQLQGRRHSSFLVPPLFFPPLPLPARVLDREVDPCALTRAPTACDNGQGEALRQALGEV